MAGGYKGRRQPRGPPAAAPWGRPRPPPPPPGRKRRALARRGGPPRPLLLGDIHPFGAFFGGRLATQFLEQRRGAFADAVQRARPVERDAHDAGLLGERLQNRLADPPHGVGDELDPFGLVELVGGPDQAEVALVDQIRERHALVLVLLGYGDDEPQVRADELAERFLVALLDALGQRDFFLTGDQRVLADLAQVLIQRSLVERGSLRRVQLPGLLTPPGAHDAARYALGPEPTARTRGLDLRTRPSRPIKPSRCQRISVSQGSASCASRS